ncbi:MAG TPA: Mbeg1-like protein [Methanosarcina sp.]|nr:Mbeg1-like protein [Methanosarcina sp.]
MMKALQYALLAKAAYSTKPDIGDKNSSARAIISKTDDGQVISFPGTDNIACWLADLNIDTVNAIGLGNVHEGFWNSFYEIHNELIEQSPSVLCGHSEGAALSLIYGAMLCFMKKPPKSIYAFEAPRISTDNTMAKLFSDNNVQVFIYQNGKDIVPDIPRLFHKWQHPAPIINVGTPIEPWPNVHDHLIDNVIKSLSGQTQDHIHIQLRG